MRWYAAGREGRREKEKISLLLAYLENVTKRLFFSEVVLLFFDVARGEEGCFDLNCFIDNYALCAING